MIYRTLLVVLLSVVMSFGCLSLSRAEGGAEGIGVANQFEQDSLGTSPLPASTYNYQRMVIPLLDYRGSERGSLGIGDKAEWRFIIKKFSDVVGDVNPEAFTVTVVDGFRSGEKIRIAVSKEGVIGTVARSAISPNAATVGLNNINDEDIIKVVVNYPEGFLYGNTGSGYVIEWVLQNTGWIVP